MSDFYNAGAATEAAVAAEREACAKACEALGPVSTYAPMACAAAIRARAALPEEPK